MISATHGNHRIVKKIINTFHNINDLIKSGKKFLKTSYRIQLYDKILSNKTIHPKPIITRRGTWLKSAVFYTDNFE